MNSYLQREFYQHQRNTKSLLWNKVKGKIIQGKTIKKKDVDQFVENQMVTQLHHKAHRVTKSKWKPILSLSKHEKHFADLTFMNKTVKGYNGGSFILLTIIDIFSRYAWVYPLRNKTKKTIHDAFVQHFKTAPPRILQTDNGSEFKNHLMKSLCKQHDVIQWFVKPYDHTAQSVIERFNGTIKRKIITYMTSYQTNNFIDILPKVVKSYNNTKHSTIKMKPNQVKDRDQRILELNQKRAGRITSVKKLKVGDQVRIWIDYGGDFRKDTDQNWSSDIYTIISERNDSYKLKTESGKVLDHSFQWHKLLVVKDVQTNPFANPDRKTRTKTKKEKQELVKSTPIINRKKRAVKKPARFRD